MQHSRCRPGGLDGIRFTARTCDRPGSVVARRDRHSRASAVAVLAVCLFELGRAGFLCCRFRGYDVMAGFLPVNGAQARGRTRNDQMTDKTAIQRIKELDQERATLFAQAKEEA